MTDEKILKELQTIEKHLQHYIGQKQGFQSQLLEVTSALDELKEDKETYKILGNIMVKVSQATIKEELGKKKEMLQLRINAIKEQEDGLKEKAQKLQKSVQGENNGSV